MSQESKYTLLAQNQSSFPNNTTGYITPEILREFNIDMIDSLVDEITFSAYSASNAEVIRNFSSSVDTRLDSLELFSSSLDATYATDAQLAAVSSALNTSKVGNSQTSSMAVSSSTYAVTASYSLTASFAINAAGVNTGSLVTTSSFNTLTQSFNQYTSSTDTKIAALNTISASYLTFTQSYYTESSSFSQRIDAVNDNLVTTSSFNSFTSSYYVDSASFDSRIDNFVAGVGFITTGSTLTETQYISGALVFTGSARIQIATASFVNVGSGNSPLNLQYEPSASAFSYLEANTSLPQYLNQAVKAGVITSGSIVGGFVKVMPNPSLVATGTTGSINQIGLEWVSQSSTDYREWFGYNGNPQSDGEKALIVQRGLHKVAGNGLGFSLASAASYSVGTPIYWDNVNSQGAMTVTRPTSGQVLRLGYIAAIQDDPSNPYVREMWYDPFWEEGETFYNAKLSGSVTLTNSNLVTTSSFNSYTASQAFLNGTFATTGSNTFTGNQTINANLYVSSSNTSDVVVNGQVFISSSATGGTTAPKLTVSGSAGQSIINRNSISTRNATYLHNVQPAFVDLSSTATADAVGLTIDTTSAGATGWTAGGAIYVNNVSGDTYPAAIGFQNKANYTDGRVTVLKPLIVSGSTTITGSFTSSLETGKFYVGNLSGITEAVATGSFVSNTADIYTSSAAVQQIVTLTQSEWNSISGSSNSNTLYIIL